MTERAFSVVTPAYRAERTIVRAAASVLAQTVADWELIIVADDETDYRAVLGQGGISDPRIRYLTTGGSGSGSPPARNIGLDAARNRYIAILDADDLMHPEKLQRVEAALRRHPLVSTALNVTDAALHPLRTVGVGPDRALAPGEYKFVNISMDSMLVYDRHTADPRFDATLPCLTDIDFLLRLFAVNAVCFHLGTPLHSYVKQPGSVSNKPGVTRDMVATKRLILRRLQDGYYPLAREEGRAGLIDFYRRSLAAEQGYEAVLAKNPAALFEDHLESYLASAS